MKTLLSGICCLGICSASMAQEQGPLKITGSLFNASTSLGMISNRLARRKGDMLTIVVSESATGSTTASTTATKKDATTVSGTSLPALSAVTNQFLTGLLKNVSNGALAGGNTAATSAVAGAGTSSTSTAFSANVTVEVVDVTPTGNLIIEGRRTIKMNKQSQTLLLQGTVRPDDILPDNTILSQRVSDLRLVADGKGIIADRQRQGILTKLLSWIF